MKKTVTLLFDGKKVNAVSARIWSLGNVPLEEKEVLKNLGEIWLINRDCKQPPEKSIKKGFKAILGQK